nr:hypothetical protein [Motilibacter rhizosphaerae]
MLAVVVTVPVASVSVSPPAVVQAVVELRFVQEAPGTVQGAVTP